MKRNIIAALMISSCIVLASCGNDDKKDAGNKGDGNAKETAASVAKRWCDLNGNANKAAYGPDQEKAEKALKAFEDEMESKYKNDEAFLKEVEKEVEKCEGDSEK